MVYPEQMKIGGANLCNSRTRGHAVNGPCSCNVQHWFVGNFAKTSKVLFLEKHEIV